MEQPLLTQTQNQNHNQNQLMSALSSNGGIPALAHDACSLMLKVMTTTGRFRTLGAPGGVTKASLNLKLPRVMVSAA